MIGCAVYGMAAILLGLLVWLGFLEPALYGWMVAATTISNVVFYGMFRSGFNLRFADPSLTMLQIGTGTLLVMLILYFVQQARGALLLFYLVAFVFGVFRLNTRQYLWLNAFVLTIYGGMIVSLQYTQPDTIDLRLELAQWVALAFVLPSFALIGGYISQMRRSLHERNHELQTALQRIQEMAIRDELTGAHNRRYIVDALQREHERVGRLGGTYSIAMMDLDYFKQVNDTYGHMVGDRVLARIAELSPQCLRGVDGFARFGGEEFLILMPRAAPDEAQAVVERLRARIEAVGFEDIVAGLTLTVSIGVAAYRPGESIAALLERADAALYRAKGSGRNRALAELV